MNETIEATARARGMTVDALHREASERVLQHMTPTHRAAVLLRESRRATSPTQRVVTEAKATPKATTQTADLTPQLEKAFAKLGHSTEAAKVAARGRGGRAITASTMVEAGKALGLSASGARRFARGRGLSEAATDGSGFKASDYAYAPDAEDPTTWRFLLAQKPRDGALGAFSADLVKKAAAALSVDASAVNQPDVPKASLAAVKQTVAGAWTQAGLPLADMPPGLTEAALRTAFSRMGLSREAAQVAAHGRNNRRR